MEDTRLGSILLEGGIVEEADLDRCLLIQSMTGGTRPIGEILVEQRLLTKATLQRLLELQRSRVALRCAEIASTDAMSGTLLRDARANGASEIIVSEGRAVRIRVAGEWRELTSEAVSGPDVWDFVRETMGGEVLEELADRHYVVRAWQDPEHGVGSATAFRQFDGVAVRITFAATRAMTVEEAGLPTSVVDLVRAGRGLVLLVGERGIGRADVLAPLLAVATADAGHYAIVLNDDPLQLPSGGALVARRRLGLSPQDRAAALRAALREDPDVLAIADVGDPETFDLALRAAEGGRLVLACIDASSVVAALHRLLDFYPVYDIPRVRANLAAALKAVLVRHQLPGAERTECVVASELLVVDDAVRETLRTGELGNLGLLLRMEGGTCGHSLDHSLLELLAAVRVRVEDVFVRAEEKAWLLERTRNLPTTTR
jgi:twitching motility protein PilT